VIVLYPKYNFWSSIVAALNVEEASGEIFATRTEINNFNVIKSLICKQYVLWLHVAVDDAFPPHELQALTYLLGHLLEKMLVQSAAACPSVHLLKFVEIHTQVLKDDDNVLPELEAACKLYEAVVTFIIVI